MKILSFCDKDTSVGLRLAGITNTYIPDENAINSWNKITDRDDIGIILITESLAEKLGKILKEFRLRNNIPVIVEIPDKKGRKKEHIDYISHLIKKAVGVEVKR